jgi:hypothetical protein
MSNNPENSFTNLPPVEPKLQRTLLAEFRQDICTQCIEFDPVELKCTMIDVYSKSYYSDPAFDCPIGSF